MTSEGVIMQTNNFTPVCIEYQQKIREYFGWNIQNDEEVLEWLLENITKFNIKWGEENQNQNLKELMMEIKDVEKFVVIGANVTKKEIMALSKKTALIVADGAIGAILELKTDLIKNIVCLVSDGDGLPYITNEKIGNMKILLHAHGHARKNLEYILDIWNKWEYPPKIIISHQTFESKEPAINFGGFSDGDRAVCMLHACGINQKNIRLIGFNSNNIGGWTGQSDTKKKIQKLKWMREILEELGYVI